MLEAPSLLINERLINQIITYLNKKPLWFWLRLLRLKKQTNINLLIFFKNILQQKKSLSSLELGNYYTDKSLESTKQFLNYCFNAQIAPTNLRFVEQNSQLFTRPQKITG